MSDKLTITAKVIAHAFDSPHAVQYMPNDQIEFTMDSTDYTNSGIVRNLTTGYTARFSRQLFYLRTPRGKWIFDFDRAGSSNTELRMFFCKECGEPFDRLNAIGTHTREKHNKTEAIAKRTQRENDDEEEERLLAQAREDARKLKEQPDPQVAEAAQAGA